MLLYKELTVCGAVCLVLRHALI